MCPHNRPPFSPALGDIGGSHDRWFTAPLVAQASPSGRAACGGRCSRSSLWPARSPAPTWPARRGRSSRFPAALDVERAVLRPAARVRRLLRRAARAAGSGQAQARRGRERLRAGRPPERLRAAVERSAPARPSRSSTPTTCRPPSPTSPRTAASSGCRRARPRTAASARSTRTAARRRPPRTPAGARRSRSTSTWSRRSARSARSCSSRRSSASIANLGTAVNQAVAQGAVAVSNSYGGVGELVRVELGQLVLQARRRRDHRVERRQRLRDELPGRVAVGHLGRRHLAQPRVQRARLDGDGLVGRRQRLLARTRRSRRSRPTPAARAARSPTSPRSRTRRPASPSTTATARQRLDGLRRHERRRRRSSPRSTRWRPRRPRAPTRSQYPYGNTGSLFDVTSGSNGSCSPAYLCNGAVGYDGPTGLGTPNGVAAFGPGAAAAAERLLDRGEPDSGTVTAGSGTTATVSTATTSGIAQSVSLARERPAGRRDGVVLAGERHLGRLVDADALDVGLDAGRHVPDHDHGHGRVGLAHDDLQPDGQRHEQLRVRARRSRTPASSRARRRGRRPPA